MAKNNNFQDFVTDIANAIRIKLNTTELYNPQDFYNKIVNGNNVNCNNIDYLEVVYNVTSTASTTQLYNSFTNFTSVYVDGVKVDSLSKNYTFSTTGKHTVKYYGITTIPTRAFAQCSNIISVIIPKDVTTISSYAFYSCSNLETVSMSDSVTSIGDIAFSYCPSLKKIELSSSIRTIGGACFYGCSSLTEIICRAKTEPTLGDNTVFYDIARNGTLTYPTNSTYSTWELYLSLFNWNIAHSTFDNSSYEESDVVVESVQQFTTHIANAIRIAKNMGDVKINPQDFYNLIIQ